MRNGKKTILIAMVFCVGLAGFCSAKPARMTAKEKQANKKRFFCRLAQIRNWKYPDFGGNWGF